jgi:ABC-type transport system involved in cytochrome bd biosynthesis fused ATPase/permease subunit
MVMIRANRDTQLQRAYTPVMKTHASFGLLMLVLWLMMLATPPLLSGCSESKEQVSLAKEQVEISQQMLDALKSVKDVATAKAAEPKLKEISQKMKALEEKFRAQPANASVSSTEQQIGSQMSQIGEALMEERQRISSVSPEAMRLVSAALEQR